MLMRANERESVILKRLQMPGFLSFRDLDLLVTASSATLRRDLDRLAEQDKLKRMRGGAQLVAAEHVSLSGVPFHENLGRNLSQKQAIGRTAAALCRQGEAVIIDAGSTTVSIGVRSGPPRPTFRAMSVCPAGAGRGCGDGESAGWRVIASATFEAPASVAGLDDIAVPS